MLARLLHGRSKRLVRRSTCRRITTTKTLTWINRYQEWEKSSGDTHCSGTSICSVAKLTGSQYCQSRSETISADVGLDIEGFSLGLSVTEGFEQQQCNQASDTTACTWDDQQCHTVWTQQPMVRSVGYMRKRCNWGKGDETQCMTDWTVDTPVSAVNYGCGSKCTDTNHCGNTDGSPCS